MAYSTQTCNTISIRLDEANYPAWFFLMQHHLQGHGLFKFVDGTYPCPYQFLIEDDGSLSSNNSGLYERWLEQDSSAICMIANTLSADALTLVIGCQTSKEVWSTLKQRYAIVSDFHIMQLKSKLQNIRKGSDSIEKYLLRFKSIRDQLAVAGVHMSDENVKFIILSGLPSEYGYTRQIIRSKSDVGLEEVRSLLLSAECEIELENRYAHLPPLAALVAQNGMLHRHSCHYDMNSAMLSPPGFDQSFNLMPSLGNHGLMHNCMTNCITPGMLSSALNSCNANMSNPSVNHMSYSPQSNTTGFMPSSNTMSFSSNGVSSPMFGAQPGVQNGFSNSVYGSQSGIQSGNGISGYMYGPQPVFQNFSQGPNCQSLPNNYTTGTSHTLQSIAPSRSTTQNDYMMSNTQATVGFVNPSCNTGFTQVVNGVVQSQNANCFSEKPQLQNSAFIGNYSPQDGETYPLFPNAKGNSNNKSINTKNGSNQNYGNNNDKPKYNENLICQICEKLDHGAWKCYQRNTHQQQTSSYSMSKVVDPLPVAAAPQLSSLPQSPLMISPGSSHEEFVSSIPDKNLLHCRRSFYSGKLCQALPRVPPG